MAKHETVEAYLADLPPDLADPGQILSALIGAAIPQATAAIRWAHPTWSIGKVPICYVKAASKHLTFGFWRGASIQDASGRLESGGTVMAHVKIRTVEDIDPTLFTEWCRQAYAIESGQGIAKETSG